MKKIFALVLAIAMLLCAAAFAEEQNLIRVKYDDSMNIMQLLPEGYKAEADVTDGGILTITVYKDENSLGLVITVAADAELDEAIRLNDLSDEEKAAFAASIIEDVDDLSWKIMTSGHGTEAVVHELAEDAYDSATIASVYYGYDILMYVGYADGRQLTDADLELAMQFFTDLTFEAQNV